MLSRLRLLVRRILALMGHALGSLVIVLWRRPNREEYPVSVHILVSSGSWHYGLLAAISLESCSEKNWRFVFHDDGSITGPQRKRIEKTLPRVEFIPRTVADARMAEVLTVLPKCLRNRSAHNFFLKIFDFHPFTPESKFIVLDSDVVFFQRPSEIVEWVEKDSVQVFYNKDTQEKYCNPRSDLEGDFDFQIWEKFNSGLVLMQSAAMNLPLAESLFEKFEDRAHHPQFFEQTLYCLMSSAWGRGGALPPTYEINWGYLRSPGAVCRHYVGAFKHDLLYIEGATLLFFRLMPRLILGIVRSAFSGFRGFVASLLILVGLLGVIGWVGHGPMVSGVKKFFTPPPFEAVHARSGLPRTHDKLSSGSPLTIAFLGGSITQNAESEGFIAALKQRISSDFPKVHLKIVNAGMASTDSAWGAKRIDRDVLEHCPDLVFVEFAVNDGDRNSATDMERIVRKIHASAPKAEVVFIYTTSDSAFRKLLKGQLSRAIAEHEKVASHYGIPSVVLGSDLASRIKSGEWKWGDFSNDACHPTSAGYESYNRDFLSAVDRLLKEGGGIRATFPEPIFDTFPLRPPKISPAPVTQSDSLIDGNGTLAIRTDRMPILGRQWIDEPFFKTTSGSVWKLEYAFFSVMPNHSNTTADQVHWAPARWFEEAGGFTGERSRILAGGDSPSSELWVQPYLSPGSVELPQISWLPEQSGNFLVDLSVDRIEGHVNESPASAGFDLLVQRGGGALEMLTSSSAGENDALKLRYPVSLLKGDIVVLRPFAKGYEFLNFKNVDLVIGEFENPTVP